MQNNGGSLLFYHSTGTQRHGMHEHSTSALRLYARV